MSSSTCSDPLCSTSGRRNFHRVTRLLISGCTQVARKNFDALIPPWKLVSELNDPTNIGKLNKARITPPQRNLLYPPPGTPVDPSKFDITILNLLFRNICGLSPPSTGWSAKPNPSDVSFEADLIRIRFHRNEVYGHVDESMEIDDHKFQALWKDISECLLRMAANVGSTLETEWRKIISDFKMKPLTPEEEGCKEELESWCNFDKDVKEELEGLKKEVKGEREEIKCMAQKVDALSVVLSKRREENQQPIINTLSISCCGFTIISLRCGKACPSLDFLEPDTQVITRDIARNELKTGVFREQLEKKVIKVRSEYEGSLIVTVESGSLEILQRFWEEYTSGRLTEMAEKYLVTQELLDRFGLQKVRLCTTVDLAEYKRSRRELVIFELGDKVHLDHHIIENVEVLIDKGNLLAALKLISEEKEEQELQRETDMTNFQLEKDLDENEKFVETGDISRGSCQLTTCDRAEQDLAQINSGEREDAVNCTNDISFRCQSVEISREHETKNQSRLDHRIKDENKDSRGTTSSEADECRPHPKCRSNLIRPESMQQEIIVKTDYITGTSQHLVPNENSEDPTELTKLTQGICMVTNQIECKIDNENNVNSTYESSEDGPVCPHQLQDQDLANTELLKINVEHILNNAINVINSHTKFRKGQTTNPRDEGVLDYKKKKDTNNKYERDNDIDYIIKTYQDRDKQHIESVQDMFRDGQIQNVLQENAVNLKQIQIEFCINEYQENLRAIQFQDRQKLIDTNLEEEEQKDREFSLDAKKDAVDAKDWQRLKKKLKSEDTNERPDSSTGHQDINHREHQRPHSAINKKSDRDSDESSTSRSNKHLEFEQRQMIVIAEREKDEKLQSPREEEETDEMALGQQQDPDNSYDSDSDNC